MAEKTMNEKEKYLDEIEDKIRTIGVLTSGGDAPGMNAAIRAVVRRALAKGLKVRGIRRGYHGLLKEEIIDLTARDVSDIVQRGGTILQTARCKTMRTEEGQQKAAAICKKYGIDTQYFDFSHAPEFFENMEPQEVRAELAKAQESFKNINARMEKSLQQERNQTERQQPRMEAYPKRDDAR